MTEATNPGNNANYGDYIPPYPIDSGKFTTLVGEFQLSAGPYGTFDQDGNVFEWNEAIIDGSYYVFSRGARGGWYGDISLGLSAAYRYDDLPTAQVSAIGFRMVNVPEPGSITLLFTGIACLLTYARRRRKSGA
jgi:formylglycine-generating enzyme required for sulfatase activity